MNIERIDYSIVIDRFPAAVHNFYCIVIVLQKTMQMIGNLFAKLIGGTFNRVWRYGANIATRGES